MTDRTKARRLPGPLAVCGRCKLQIVWARTVASETGPGGRPMPLDPVEHPLGNVAVPAHPSLGSLTARALKKDEHPVDGVELRAMPHFATCQPVADLTAELPDNVIPINRPRSPK